MTDIWRGFLRPVGQLRHPLAVSGGRRRMEVNILLAGSHPNYLAGREKYLMIILKSGGGREISLTLCRGHPSFFWNFLLESIGAPDHRAIDDHQGARHHDFQIWRQNNFDNLVNMRWLQDVEFE